MPKVLKNFPILTAAILGFVLLIPFIILEVVNRAKFNDGFPFSVFTFTWFLQTAFMLILMPVIKAIRSKKSIKENPGILLRIAILLLIAYIWSSWIVDQWPCFMGVPNCD